MPISNLHSWYQRIFALVFFLGLFLVLGNSLSAAPFELDTRLWMQSQLVGQYADLRLMLGDRVFPKVLVGKDGWLVFTAEHDLDDYQRNKEISLESMRKISVGLTEIHKSLQSQGKTLIVVIVPNKSTIYPEGVPDEISQISSARSRLTLLTTYLKKVGPPVLLDLRPALEKAKSKDQLYYKTDTHWNSLGAFVAYQEIMKELNKAHPTLKAHPLKDFKVVSSTPIPLDLARNINTNLYQEPQIELVPTFQITVGARQIPIGDREVTMHWTASGQLKLLMYHDSFGFPLIPLLGSHFKESIFIPHYSGNQVWSLNWIAQENPDVVIIEFAERYLHDLEQLLNQ